MRTLSYCVAVTIDGFIGPLGGGDPSGDPFLLEGDHQEPLFGPLSDILPGPARDALGVHPPPRRWDTVVEGRGSYQVGLDAGVADAYPHLRHYVVSRTLTATPAAAVHLVPDDPLAAVRALKAEDGDLGVWLVGGGTLAAVLLPEIDEIVLKLHPVTMGAGIPLFAGGGPDHGRFALTEHRVFASGVVFLTYARRPVEAG